MIWFWIIAGLFIAGALLLVLPPLLAGGRPADLLSRRAVNVNVYRDQLQELDADLAAGTLSRDRYDEARAEIERRLLEDAGEPAAGDEPAAEARQHGWVAIAVGVAVPVAAIGLYLAVGNPGAMNAEQQVAAEAPPHALDPQQVEAMVAQLAERLKAEPDNAEGWVMLARTYNAMGRFQDASAAYGRATALVPNNAQLLADHADALAMAQGRRLAGEPEKLIERALAIDPNNLKALALAGTVAFEKKDYAAATALWQRMLPLVPPESDTARAVQGSIAEAQSLAKKGGTAPPTAAAEPPPAKVAAAGGRVSGVVRLAPELSSKVAPTDTVFIFARAAEGPRMPLAILRKQAGELPVNFVLDDSMAMAPGMSLSAFGRVVVGARVSKSANATPQSGDLEGASAPVKVGAADIAVVIDDVVR